MGNWRSREHCDGPACKYPKLCSSFPSESCCPTTNQTDLLCASTSVPVITPFLSNSWEHLPYPALLEVYRHLPANDKSKVARTCTTWLLPFSRPSLWRRGNFWFDGVNDWRALRFVVLMASALRHVTVDCSAPEAKLRKRNSDKKSTAHLSAFLASLLNSDNRKLVSLCVRNLHRLYWYSYYHPDGANLCETIISLVAKQDSIKHLDVTNAGVSEAYAVQLVESVQCPDLVQSLTITDVVVQTHGEQLAHNPAFGIAMKKFSHLTDLSLSDDYLSHDLLMSLADTLSPTLRRMRVKAKYDWGRTPSERLAESWRHFCGSCCHLQLTFVVTGKMADRHLVTILPSTLSLHHLEMTIDHIVLDMKSIYHHLAHFKVTLKSFSLKFHCFVMKSDIEYLTLLLNRLDNLHSLSIDSTSLDSPSIYRLSQSIRRIASSKSHDSNVLDQVVINGKRIELQENWPSFIFGLLAYLSENII